MSLETWLANRWLRRHETSAREIRDLFQIVERDLRDASSGGISADWQYGIAYNAALKLCTIALYASGYQPERQLAHYRTLQALPLILGPHRQDDAAYLEACRQKRNTVEYDYAGGASKKEATELISFGQELKTEVSAWLREKHPELLTK